MLRARIVALLASLLLLWPLGAPAHARYFCRMMDRVLDTCCCGHESELEALHREARARAADCCVRLTQGALPTADARRDGLISGGLPALPAAGTPSVLPAFESEVLVAAGLPEEAVLARGPPLFLKHCVFLI
jgi:hypothetical protein